MLRKREHYRACFHQFVPEKIARMSDAEIEQLLTDAGLIRNRLKLYGIRKNALALLALEQQGVDFSELLWGFVGGKTMVNRLASMDDAGGGNRRGPRHEQSPEKSGFYLCWPHHLLRLYAKHGVSERPSDQLPAASWITARGSLGWY